MPCPSPQRYKRKIARLVSKRVRPAFLTQIGAWSLLTMSRLCGAPLGAQLFGPNNPPNWFARA